MLLSLSHLCSYRKSSSWSMWENVRMNTHCSCSGFIRRITCLQKSTWTSSHYYDVMAFSHLCSCKTRNTHTHKNHCTSQLLHLCMIRFINTPTRPPASTHRIFPQRLRLNETITGSHQSHHLHYCKPSENHCSSLTIWVFSPARPDPTRGPQALCGTISRCYLILIVWILTKQSSQLSPEQ